MKLSLGALRERALDAADMAIDFATLGEYGLEPASAGDGGPCESRGHAAAPVPIGAEAVVHPAGAPASAAPRSIRDSISRPASIAR